MAKAYAKKFYNSKEWIKARKSFISLRVSIDGGICQECKKDLGYIVDHVEEIKPINIDDPNITLNQENFRYLCLICHNRKTFGEARVTGTDVMFNEMGELIVRD